MANGLMMVDGVSQVTVSRTTLEKVSGRHSLVKQEKLEMKLVLIMVDVGRETAGRGTVENGC